MLRSVLHPDALNPTRRGAGRGRSGSNALVAGDCKPIPYTQKKKKKKKKGSGNEKQTGVGVEKNVCYLVVVVTEV